ncbi:peptidoglycan recognition protein [Streptomyces durbertensis]|uniref:Peptidoglycan recognition protein n=1 Tax=Streptomyces durbertensis TaxID=2448886 RepID=A0ABR6EF75_9ACTN|nr:peptidoglycan recognition protein [Streptomyces durbertensis]MBB1243615.1 peptidoglycan recognition protein [Streptomyces durbertensis]
MRAILAASLGSLCTAALLAPSASAAASTAQVADAVPAKAGAAADRTAPADGGAPASSGRPPATRSLPLTGFGTTDRSARTAGQPTAPGAAGLARRDVAPFSLLGVVWDDASHDLNARVEVRTRAAGTDRWSRWLELESHRDAPDSESPERDIRGSTAPLWVGEADGVEVRLIPQTGADAKPLPAGLRVALVDPGRGAAADGPEGADGIDGTDRSDGKPGKNPTPELTPEAAAASAVNAQLAELGAQVIPPLSRKETQAQLGGGADSHIGPRPGIVTRAGWNANESWRERQFLYTNTVRAAFVHHTAMSNNYTCAQAPSVIRSIYQYHTRTLGWRDIGYNFLVDKCGTIYEGRAGGVAKPVQGAHTYGFNSNTTGIAVLGSFGATAPSREAVEGVAKLIGWKLGLHGINPAGSVTLTSGGGKYPAGTAVTMRAVSGHRDGFATECPGAQLYGNLGTVRSLAARLQGR